MDVDPGRHEAVEIEMHNTFFLSEWQGRSSVPYLEGSSGTL